MQQTREAGGSVPAGSEQLADRLFAGLLGSLETFTVYVGVRRGLYRVLAEHGPLSPGELAAEARIHPRYAREWLEQQAVAGILHAEQDFDVADPYDRRFSLPGAHARVLVAVEDPLYLGAAPLLAVGIAEALPELLAALPTGGGVPYVSYGSDAREGIAGMNRPMFTHDLVDSWLGAMPDVMERLRRPGARILDLGCGHGWSSLAMARALPEVAVTGLDLDASSVEQAQALAGAAGMTDRVTFVHADAAAAAAEPADLVTLFECLHDMADPVGTLSAVRRGVRPGGAVLVGDERVAEAFGAPGDEVERLNYAFSVLHCLPATRAEGARVEAGTVLRPDVVAGYAASAGFASCEVLPVEHDLWRFYRLAP
ncbi:class I SAM-dependent methyltransferase [Streptomyces sp. TR06-5]|uniref:class I SAM-dependent methyltransferase n=1 Tax=unclassified Streptomyces TaxID=2593676 RepID=UPI0039A37DE0